MLTKCGMFYSLQSLPLIMQRTKSLSPILILAILLLAASSVSADPVTIATGSVNYFSSSPGSFTLNGSGLAVTGTTAPLNSSISLLANGFMAPGGSGSTGGSVDTQDNELFVSVPFTALGATQVPGASLLQLRFSSSGFVVPAGVSSGFIVVAPFALTSGLLEGYPGSLGDSPLFSVPLTGQGTTTLTFVFVPSGGYRLQSQTFVFGPSVQQVTVQSIPEPTTVLLLFSGILALAGYRKRTTL
jgi:hypothetical protein